MSETANPAGTVSSTALNQFTAAEATGTFGTMDRGNITELAARTRYLDTNGRLVSALATYIGDSANTKVTLGQTINQGSADDEIVAWKSSDVSHGMTDLTEDDTFFAASKVSPTAGGASLNGYTEGTIGLRAFGIGVSDDTTKSTSGTGYVTIETQKKSGTSGGAPGANSNLATINANGTTRFIFDADGDSHQDVGTAWTNF